MTKLERKATVSIGCISNGGIDLATTKLSAVQGAHGYITGSRQSELDTAVSSSGSSCSSMEG